MKSLFRHRRHQVPALMLTSMPDLIFTILFFFMIVTHMRNVDPKVSAVVPQGSSLQQTGHKAGLIHIYIGKPIGGGDDFRVQVNNSVVATDHVAEAVAELRDAMSDDDKAHATVSLKADRDVPMKMVSKVKRQLQEAMTLRVCYAGIEKSEKEKKK